MSRWWIRGGIVVIVFTEIFMLPFTLMEGWWVAAMVPVLVVGTAALTWLFDRAVRWVDGAP